ncbi:Programmed cell death protein 6 [Thoreauomyces humboldtii]|nr:Programmed cell death protein 6 [Thoreauomyces humboldtii]
MAWYNQQQQPQPANTPPLPPRTHDVRRPSYPQQAPQPYVAFPTAGGSSHPLPSPYSHPAYPHSPSSSTPQGHPGSYAQYQQHAPASPYASHPSASEKADFSRVQSNSNATADLERRLNLEREQRVQLEERELERVKNMSMLEGQLHSMKLNLDRTSEHAARYAEIESQLLHEQQEKRQLMDRLGAAAQTESRLEHEIEEKHRLEQILDAESRHRRELQDKVKLMTDDDTAKKAEADRLALQQRVTDLENKLQENQKALSELANTKLDLTKNLDVKTTEIASLKRRLDEGEINQNLDRMKADVERARAETARTRSGMDELARSKDIEIARLLEKINNEAYERSASVHELRELQMRYEPPAPPVGDESVYQRPPPSQPLPPPKGVDHELWGLFAHVDPYQLKAINAVQLRDILNHGPWPPLEYSTVRILYHVYDRTGKSFKFDDFSALWELINKWVQVFRSHDHHTDEAEFGHVDRSDLRKVLKECGIAASERFLTALQTQGNREELPLGWDDFMRCAARVKLMQDSFKKIDMDKDNWITINYDQCLDLVVNSSV